MTIRQQGGIFGRNPTFNNVEIDGTLTIDGSPIPDPTDTLTTSDIGVTVQAYDVGLESISGLTTSADKMIYSTASDVYATTGLTSAGRAILDDASATAQRTTLGLGSIATQDNTSVNIDGGNIDGTTIGNSVKGAGSFTTVVATTAFKETNGNSSIANGATLVITVPSPRRPQLLSIYSTYNLGQGWFGLVKGDGSGNIQTNAITDNGGVTVAGTSGNQVTLTNTYGGTANIYWSLMPLGVAV